MKKIKEYLKTIIKENETCVLALSGGPDSMCLLELLKELKKEKEFSLICAHINHNTRVQCEEEKKFIEKYLKKTNIPLEYYKIEKYKKGSFNEEEGREKRYEFLKEVCKKHNATILLTAHHKDDLTETILMRILRGSTLNGYSGIKKESIWEDIKIIRPLLSIRKKEILEYLNNFHIPYVIDETNNELIHFRNKIRHKIIPELEKIEPKYLEKIEIFQESLEQAHKLITSVLEEKKEKIIKEGKIIKEEFLTLEQTWQEEVLKEYIKDIYNKELKRISRKHLKIALNFIRNQKETQEIDFPGKFLLKKDRQSIWLEKKQKRENYCIKVESLNILPDGSIVKKIDKYQEKSNFEIHLNSKEITFPLFLKTRETGMKMEVKNLNGSKKISDILINSKIKKEEKEKVPILVDKNGTVLWVLGIKKSKYDLEKNENYDIIYKYIKKEGI